MLTDATKITVTADYVEYRTPMASTVRVVRVWTRLHEPRFVSFTEQWQNGVGVVQEPLSLFVSEANFYIQHAVGRIKEVMDRKEHEQKSEVTPKPASES